MIDGIRRYPDIAVVAVFTDVACLYVCEALTRGRNTVVATATVSRDSSMIENRRSPGERRVTVVTSIAAGDVSGMFAGCCNAVMTRVAGADDLRVVNRIGRSEYVGIVTILASVACQNVRNTLADRVDAVMAVDTIAHNIQMIKIGRQPGNG